MLMIVQQLIFSSAGSSNPSPPPSAETNAPKPPIAHGNGLTLSLPLGLPVDTLPLKAAVNKPHDAGDDSDSDLTDLDDPKFKPPIRRSFRKKPKIPQSKNRDHDSSDSDYEVDPPVTVKTNGKRKKPTVESETEPVKSKVKVKEKKVLVAVEVKWKDIPDWGDRTDCPLLTLPTEILDRCFGLWDGLRVCYCLRSKG